MENKLTLDEQFLTLEQTKELQELGVDFSNANFAFVNVINPYNSTFKHEITKYYVELRDDLIPTLSVAEMIEMIPEYIPKNHTCTYVLSVYKVNKKWCVTYESSGSDKAIYYKHLLRDSLFEILKWLKQNKFI